MEVIDAGQVGLAARAVEAGGLVVVPTDRWYMLCCDAADADACARVFAAKQRPADKTLLLVAPTVEAVRERFHLTADAERLIDAFWPGHLALRLRWRVPDNGDRYTAVGSPVALVTHTDGVLGDLARACTTLLAATSANVSGTPGGSQPGPAVSLAEVHDFVSSTGADVAYAIDGGVCPLYQHLTIIDGSNGNLRLERPGAVSDRVLQALGAAPAARHPSPRATAPVPGCRSPAGAGYGAT